MTYILLAAIVALSIAATLLYIDRCAERRDAVRFSALFWEARTQLGKVHDALSDIPKDAGTELGTVILRMKHRHLKVSNRVKEAHNALWAAEATNPETVKLVHQLDKILKSND